MLSEISPRQLAQASSLNTVNRAVASSLGIAILATLVQTQSLIHFGHLAEQVTASSQLGQLLLGIQAAFVAHGANLLAAHNAALQLIARYFLQRQAFVLAVQDALRLTIVVVVLAIIAVLFVRNNRLPQRIPERAPRADVPPEREERPPAEALLAGK